MASSSPTELSLPQANNPLDEADQLDVEQTLPTEVDPDPEHDDADSAVGDHAAPSLASLTESILQYRTLLGRTYQSSKTNDYWAPNDEPQNDGLDMFHNAVTMLLEDKLFLAPIGANPKRVLDIATGTGLWAMDFADAFPETEVIGTDISPIQSRWVPPNLEFQIDDMNLPWTWPEDHFDLIHLRVLYGCVPDWEELYKKARRYLQPGGWLQDFEMDTLLESDHDTLSPEEKETLRVWGDLFIEAGKKTGRSFDIARGHQIKEKMEAAGFVDVVEKKMKIPCGQWPKDSRSKHIGALVQFSIEESLDGLVAYLGTQVLDWSVEEVTVLTAKLRRIVKRKWSCTYIPA